MKMDSSVDRTDQTNPPPSEGVWIGLAILLWAVLFGWGVGALLHVLCPP